MGADMERRVPMPAITTWELKARCVGNADAIGELLEYVTYLGKRHNLGTAVVRRWNVHAREWEPGDVLLTGGRLSRAIPAAAVDLLPARPAEPTSVVGWTPPQWKPSLFSDGWRVGTSVSVNSR